MTDREGVMLRVTESERERERERCSYFNESLDSVAYMHINQEKKMHIKIYDSV